MALAVSTVTSSSGAFTVDDLEAMPDDGRRYELIGGAIVMTPCPVPLHQLVSDRVQRALEPGVPEDHVVFHAPIDLDLPGGQRVEPDLVVLPWSSVGSKRLVLPVMLLVEIVSPGSTTHDRVTKRSAYAEAGVPAYWLVDLPAGEIVALRLGDGAEYEVYGRGTTVTVERPLPVTLDLAVLTHRPGPAVPSTT